jgi:hypothetical protein
MLQDTLMTLRFFTRLHFPKLNESEYASKRMAAIFNIYETETYHLFHLFVYHTITFPLTLMQLQHS